QASSASTSTAAAAMAIQRHRSRRTAARRSASRWANWVETPARPVVADALTAGCLVAACFAAAGLTADGLVAGFFDAGCFAAGRDVGLAGLPTVLAGCLPLCRLVRGGVGARIRTPPRGLAGGPGRRAPVR